MMTDVTIDRFTARYRIHADEDDVRRRLDGMLDRAFESALETGLELAGVGDAELVCVRELHVPFRADLSRTEGALAAAWAEAFGRVLRRAVAEGHRGAVRYRSPSSALSDLLRRVARRDFGPAWAWSALGLWDGGAGPDAREAARGAADALAGRPELAASVLEAAAADGVTASFLLEELHPESWRAMAEAALSAAGLPAGLADGADGADGTDEGPRPPGRTERPGSDGRRGGGRARERREAGRGTAGAEEPGSDADAGPAIPERVSASALLRRARRADVKPAAVRPIAAVALLARAPSRLRRFGDPAALVRAVAGRIVEGARGTTARPPGSAGNAESGRREDRGASEDATWSREIPATGDTRRSRNGHSEAPDPTAPSRDEPEPGRGESPATDAEPDAPAGDGRPPGRTRRGGLPFLLHLLDDVETRRALLEEPELARRSPPWILHRLGAVLASAPDDDPAVLAFCGLGPEADPPSAVEEPPTADEEGAVDAWADRLRNLLRERLDAGDRDPGAVAREVVRREATVVADPGWIEVRLSLRDVSPEIRKAGLDLDPGYLEWLGVVVRFAYV